VSHRPRVVEVAAAAVPVVPVVEVEEEEAAVGLIFEVWPTFRATLYEGDKEYRVGGECDER
jgi:hypothetical protein